MRSTLLEPDFLSRIVADIDYVDEIKKLLFNNSRKIRNTYIDQLKQDGGILLDGIKESIKRDMAEAKKHFRKYTKFVLKVIVGWIFVC